MDKFLKQLTAFLRGMTPRQKMLLAAGAAAVLIVLGVFARLSQTAEFKPLYAGLQPSDEQSVVQSLASKSISYQVSPDGTSVSVPADELDKARLELAAEGLPQSGRLGFEIFDKQNWTESDFTEQVDYQRALEGELERTIQTLGDVQSVRVHLVLPHDSLFSDRERPAKAAVVMKLRGGGLTDQEVNAVTHLVASAVDGLTPDNVTLISADGMTPIVAKGHDGIHGMDSSMDLEAALAEKVVATLTPVVGQGHVKASVTVAYDPSSGDTTQETYDPANPVLVSEQVQEENFGGHPPEGIPGTTSNVPSSPGNSAAPNKNGNGASKSPSTNSRPVEKANPANPMIAASSESEGQRSDSRTYAVSKTMRHTIDPPGRIDNVDAAVLVDDVIEQQKDAKGQMHEVRRARTPEEMKQIEDLARAAVGFDAARGDVLSVENVPFVTPPVETPTPLPIVQRVRILAEQWIWLVRYIVLLLLFGLLYLLVLRPVTNQLIEALRQGGRAGVPALAGAGGGELVSGLSESTAAFGGSELDRELSQSNSDVDRVVRMKKHLTDRVKQEPVAASQLVRTWINQKRDH
ncbi:MAG: flagellar basal-body MS-ring/collar protein FliF [Candidatus Acidiferrales bacterium]